MKYFRFFWRILTHPRIVFLGFSEGRGDMGLTFDDDPWSPRSEAYDVGRSIRRGNSS